MEKAKRGDQCGIEVGTKDWDVRVKMSPDKSASLH
jgi:hypothetical protein